MRRGIIFALMVWALGASADIIRLKNGNSIVAQNVRESNGRIEYTIGEDTFAIPKSLVLRIDTGGSPAVSRKELGIPEPSAAPPKSSEVSGQVVRDDRLDLDALSELEHDSAEAAAAGYFAAARYEERHGSPDKAERYYVRALEFTPGDVAVLEHYAALLVQMDRYSEAERFAAEATRLAPNSADAWALLGISQYYSDRSERAVRSLRRALELRPSATISEYLRKAESDRQSEQDFGQMRSAHFMVRFEGGGSIPPAVREQIVGALETHYTELENELDYSPREEIPVFLYTEQSYFDVTQAPTWTGAINDGKLRIPVRGVSGVSDELSRVLKHELAHSVIDQMTRNRCPVWLNEGVAQLLEPRDSSVHGAALARLFANNQEVPMAMLEAPFNTLNQEQASLAYAESLAAAETLNASYGMSDITRLLKRIGAGTGPEAALRSTIRGGYGDLQTEIGRYLRQRYGE